MTTSKRTALHEYSAPASLEGCSRVQDVLASAEGLSIAVPVSEPQHSNGSDVWSLCMYRELYVPGQGAHTLDTHTTSHNPTLYFRG